DATPSCMEYALHLAAKHFVEGLAPMLLASLLQKVKGAMANAMRDDTAIGLDALNSEIGGIKVVMGDDAEEDNEENGHRYHQQSSCSCYPGLIFCDPTNITFQ